VPDTQFYTQEAATAKATTIKTALALSKLHFFKDTLSPTQFTTKVQFDDNEADFDGYTSGGYALAAFSGPLNNPGGGSVITSPLVTAAYGPVGDPPVTNNIGGWWIEDATNNVRLVGTFNPTRPMVQVGDGIVLVVRDVEGYNVVILG
jgi:hypothetical protein